MKRIITIALTAVLAVSSLAGCGGGKSVNVSDVARELVRGGQYSETLTQMDSGVMLKRYGIDSAIVEESEMDAGTRAVVDEVAVIKTTDTAEVTSKLEAYIESQKASYQSYRPDEVPKLDDAVLETLGDTVVLCISEDGDAARGIISKLK